MTHRGDSPDGHTDRLRARSGVEDLPSLVKWVWRTWWVNALVTLFAVGVAIDAWTTSGSSADVAVLGVFASLWCFVTAYQFRDWRRRRPSLPAQKAWTRPWLG